MTDHNPALRHDDWSFIAVNLRLMVIVDNLEGGQLTLNLLQLNTRVLR